MKRGEWGGGRRESSDRKPGLVLVKGDREREREVGRKGGMKIKRNEIN